MFLYFLVCLRPSGQNLQIPVCNWSTTRLYDVTHLLLRQGGGGLGDRCVGREGLASGTWKGAEEESGQTELEAELGRGWGVTWSLSKEGPRLQSGRASRRLTPH